MDQKDDPIPQIPKKGFLDHLFDSAKSASGSAVLQWLLLGPAGLAGSILGVPGEVLGRSIRTSTDKRIEAAQKMLVDAINDIRSRMVDEERLLELVGSEDFADLVADILEASVATRSAEKRNLLKNILVTSSTERSASEFESHLFIRLVDELDPLHIEVLHFLNSPVAFMRDRGTPLQPEPVNDGKGPIYQDANTTLLLAFQTHPDDHVDVVCEDLVRRKLMVSIDNDLLRERSSYTTPLGKRFLAMIRA